MGCFRIYGCRKSEMLKKFQHDSDIAQVSILDYGLWPPMLEQQSFPLQGNRAIPVFVVGK